MRSLPQQIANGTFTDVTDKAWSPPERIRLGWPSGEITTNDGFPDLFCDENFGKNVLYTTMGTETFTDVTDQAGVGVELRYTGMFPRRAATLSLTIDRDGKMDLLRRHVPVAMGKRFLSATCKIGAMLTKFVHRAPSREAATRCISQQRRTETFTNCNEESENSGAERKSLSVGAA